MKKIITIIMILTFYTNTKISYSANAHDNQIILFNNYLQRLQTIQPVWFTREAQDEIYSLHSNQARLIVERAAQITIDHTDIMYTAALNIAFRAATSSPDRNSHNMTYQRAVEFEITRYRHDQAQQ